MNRSILAIVLTSSVVFAAPTPKPEIKAQQDPSQKPPSGPLAQVDVMSTLGPALSGNFGGVGAGITVTGESVMIGGGIMMGPSSALAVGVNATNSNGTTAPAGTYRVRFNFVNVSAAATLNLKSGSTTGTCKLAANPGYNNLQFCDLFVTTTGANFVVQAYGLSGPPQLQVKSLQAYKES